MVRVLHILGTLDYGGIETMIVNIYRNINREEVQFDFVVYRPTEGAYENELKQLGAKIYHITPKSHRISRNFVELSNLIKDNKYNIIHRHTSAASSIFDLAISKISGANVIISHSHNATDSDNFKEKIMKKFINFFPTHRFACSNSAAIYLFGKKQTKSGNVRIVNNAIDSKKFVYNIENRRKIRKELNIKDNQIVIGHIGRFEYQKNHEFLIDIFNEIYIKEKNALLLLIGTGKDLEKIKNKVKSLGLKNNILFLGAQSNINEYMQAMDMFILPSHFEGLPVVLIEAQAAGLKCFTSKDVVTQEAQITNLLHFIGLDEGADKWAEIILNEKFYKRENREKEIIEAKYDIIQIAKELEEFYKKVDAIKDEN